MKIVRPKNIVNVRSEGENYNYYVISPNHQYVLINLKKYRTSASRTRPPRVPYKFVGTYYKKFRFVFFLLRNGKTEIFFFILRLKSKTIHHKNNQKSVQACANEAISFDTPHDTVNSIQNLDRRAVPCIKTLYFYDLLTNV